MLYDPDSVTWFYTEDREVKTRETISGAIQAETPMDAVVCYNDQVAVEVIRTLREFGKKVPRDVSVTGFDNSLLAKNNHIPITTISHPPPSPAVSMTETGVFKAAARMFMLPGRTYKLSLQKLNCYASTSCRSYNFRYSPFWARSS